jgi:hypothetical protein
VSTLALKTDPKNKIGGIALQSTGPGWKRPTGVFFRDLSVVGDGAPLTVVLWFHGHRVRDISALFYEEATRLLPAVLASGKRVVLVAPHLGLKSATVSEYDASVLGGGKNTEIYLDQVLQGLSNWYDATVNPPGRDRVPTEKFTLGDLYVAGHSGGGTGIRSSVAALGGYKKNLRECWGFDCLYAAGQTWHQWARSQGGIPLYFYFGDGTKPSDGGNVLDFWRLVYGTLKNPLPVGSRMTNVHLAPGLLGVEMDRVAFQASEDIKFRNRPGNRYEEIRLKVDPLLDNTSKYWSTILDAGLFGHYRVVSDLLGPRLSQSLYF